MANTLATVYDAIKDAIVAKVEALKLEGLAGGVQRQLVTDPANIIFPCIVATSEGERERVLGGDTTLKNIVFPVRVFLLDRESLRNADLDAKYAGWRGQLLDAFDQEILDGVPEVAGMTVEPAMIYDSNQSAYRFVVSGVVVLADAWIARK